MGSKRKKSREMIVIFQAGVSKVVSSRIRSYVAD
jgi:hypothetical protein